MRVGVALAALSFCALGCSSGANEKREPTPLPFVEGPLIRFVDPFIGTGGLGFGVGSAYPGPAMPHGMIHPGPDTSQNGKDPDLDHFAGYYYPDPEITGFSHTRLQGTGACDLGTILVMPTTGFTPDMASGEGYRSSYSHDTETASPGYYAVMLDRYAVKVELTSALRAAIHRYTYPDGASPTLIFDPTHFAGMNGVIGSASVRVDGNRIVGDVLYFGSMSGRDGGIHHYFVAEMDRPITATQVFSAGSVTDGTSFAGVRDPTLKNVVQGGLSVALGGGSGVVTLKIAISAIDTDTAAQNLLAEAPDFDFDAMRAKAEEAWESVLSKIKIAGGSDSVQRMFYSALYRAYLMPTLFTEVGDAYRGFDHEVHITDGFTYYTDFSDWDTFRTLHPLIDLIDPELARDFAASLTTMTQQGGTVPRWPLGTAYTNTMIGSPEDILVSETYQKGITDFDAEFIYQAMRRQATEPQPADVTRGPWRDGIEDYMALGYVPDDASTTLEYAYDDWALSKFAAALGHDDDAALFAPRGRYWKNLWDDATEFIRAKDATGAFVEPFNPIVFGGGGQYDEGDAWQWSFYVPHDGAGLIEAFGSRDAFVDKLSTLFEKSTTMQWVESGPHHVLPDQYYWHSNEPCIHSAYLFNDAGRWDLAQKWAKAVLDTQYREGPDGLPGNDDSGTMSAWYVWSALGVYPIAGTTEYWLGRPIFPRALISRPGGNIEIRAPGADDGSDANFRAASIDGAAVSSRFDHATIAAGAKIAFAR